MAKSGYHPRFGYDIRIKRDAEAEAPVKAHPCAVPGCEAEGVCHAPVDPHNLALRQWLCTRHARESNENWDFFVGMNPTEIERFRAAAVIGHRPTWPLGKRTAGFNGFTGAYTIEDGYAIFTPRKERPEPRRPQRVLTPMQRQAFDLLGLEGSASLNEIKARYKELVKRFHPDANGGNRGTEERLKQVIKAYGVLRASGLT
jgi:hypothetical protein